MSWYYSIVSGNVFEVTGIEATILNAQISATKLTPATQVIFGPYPSSADAQAAKDAHPALSIPNPISGVESGFSALLGLIPRLLEAVLGIALISIAAYVILRDTTGVSITSGAKAAAKATL